MADPVEKKIGQLNVKVERDLCIGSGNCVKVEPDLFQLDDEGIAAFKSTAPDLEPGRVVEACSVCPVEALVVRDESGEQIVP